jgi:Na+/H+ antiporter NhaD/arsenite permease-like protein
MFEAHTLFVTKFIDYHTYFTLVVIALAIISYVTEKVSLEITSLFVISTFMIFFHLFPLTDAGGNNALSTNAFLLGFADPSLITIVSMLIIGQAIIQSNALNIVPKMILKISQSNGFLAIFISLFTIIIISAFMNNTPVVVIFIPILSEVAK